MGIRPPALDKPVPIDKNECKASSGKSKYKVIRFHSLLIL